MRRLVNLAVIGVLGLMAALPAFGKIGTEKGDDVSQTKTLSRTFTEKTTFTAGILDDENTCRVVAWEEGKQNLIKKIGDVLVDYYNTAVPNGSVEERIFEVLIPYIVVFESTQDQWKNKTLKIEVSATANAKDILQQITALLNNQSLTQHMIKNRKSSVEAYNTIQRIKTQIAASTEIKAAVIEAGESSKLKKAYGYAIKQLKATDCFEKGILSGLSRDYQSAIDFFTEAITANPMYAEAYYYRGIYVFSHKKDTEGALSDFNRAIYFNKEDASFYESRGICYGNAGNVESAMNDFNKGLELNPESIELLMTRGKFYTKMGELSKALEDYGKVIELDSNHIGAHFSIGLIHKEQKDYAGCIEDFGHAIALNNHFSDAFYERALAYARMGNETDKPKIIEDFQMAAKLGHTGAQDVLTSIKVEW